MIAVVIDCNVLMAAIGWRNEPYQCLVAIAQRRCRPFVTEFILDEYRRTASSMQEEHIFPGSPWPTLEWFLSAARLVQPAPVGRQRSRDSRDDPYLGCALAAKAKFIVSRDPDLLDLHKPFGIAIITPRQFLNYIAGLE